MTKRISKTKTATLTSANGEVFEVVPATSEITYTKCSGGTTIAQAADRTTGEWIVRRHGRDLALLVDWDIGPRSERWCVSLFATARRDPGARAGVVCPSIRSAATVAASLDNVDAMVATVEGLRPYWERWGE